MTDVIHGGLQQAPEVNDEVQAGVEVPEQVEAPQVQQLILGEELTDDDRNKVYERLGRPADPDGYDLTGIVPEQYNHDLVDQFKKKAHEVGMSNEATKKVAEWYKNVETAQKEAIEKSKNMQADAWMLELKRDFGNKFDVEVKNANKALAAYTDKAFAEYMNQSGLGNHPALVKAFAKIGRELSEDKLVQSETASRLAQSEELRRSEILRLRSDKAFMDKYRRGDSAAIARMNALYEVK